MQNRNWQATVLVQNFCNKLFDYYLVVAARLDRQYSPSRRHTEGRQELSITLRPNTHNLANSRVPQCAAITAHHQRTQLRHSMVLKVLVGNSGASVAHVENTASKSNASESLQDDQG